MGVVFVWTFEIICSLCTTPNQPIAARTGSGARACAQMQQTTLFDVGPPAPSPEPDEAKKVVWALTYTRTLVRSHLPNDPLLGTSYCGQAVRVAGKKYFTPEAVAEKRWKEEDNGSVKGDGSDLSFMEVLRTYGPAAFDNEIVWSMQGKNAEVQPLANAKEIALIAERGGTVRDLTPEARIKQTFNRQKGGKAMKAWYESLQGAFAAKRWKIFQDAMRKHVETFGTAYVSRQHVTAQGYHLGSAASNVRSQGNFVDGFPERRVWLDALPHWTWNALESDEYRQQLSERVAAQKAGLSSDEKAEIERKRRATFDAKSEEEKAEIARKISETKSAKSDEEKAEIVRKYKEKMNTKSEEEKAEIVRKISETKSAKSDEEKAEIVRKIRENRKCQVRGAEGRDSSEAQGDHGHRGVQGQAQQDSQGHACQRDARTEGGAPEEAEGDDVHRGVKDQAQQARQGPGGAREGEGPRRAQQADKGGLGHQAS